MSLVAKEKGKRKRLAELNERFKELIHLPIVQMGVWFSVHDHSYLFI